MAIIENRINKWINIIKETRDEIIPKMKINYYIHARDSDYLKLLEITYNQILNKPIWTREDLDIIKELQRQILEENLRLSKEAWETKINWLNDIFFFFYEWEHRTGTMCPFSSLHPLRKGKEV